MSVSSKKTQKKGEVEMGKVRETRDGDRVGECVCVCAVYASMYVCVCVYGCVCVRVHVAPGHAQTCPTP